MTGPDFLIAGAARSGTTLLCTILDRHPEVHITDPKEPHFLAYGGGRGADFRGPGDEQTINRRAVLDELSWRRLFATGSRLAGEGSVTTLYEYERSIPAIERYCPDTRIIIVLREPVARAASAHAYMRARGYETVDFPTALDREADRRAAGWQHIWHYTAESRYGDQVTAFSERFGPDQLFVLYYESLMAEPEAELCRLHRFLGLEEVEETRTLGPRVNRSGEPRSALVSAAVRRLSDSPARGLVRRATSYEARERVKRWLVRPEGIHPGHRELAAARIGPITGLPVVPHTPEWVRRVAGPEVAVG